MPESCPPPPDVVSPARRALHPRLAGLTAGVVLAATLATSAACSRDSYLVVTLQGAGPSDDFEQVAYVDVLVTEVNGPQSPILTYVTTPATGGVPTFAFDSVRTKTLSIAFTPGHSGPFNVKVAARTANALDCLGSGETDGVSIKKGDVSNTRVQLTRGAPCLSAPDAGAPTDATVTFDGCDPATAGSCPGTQTCFVNCRSQIGECVTGGTRGAGQACTSNSDCMPGTQCFNYGCGLGISVCLKFCHDDSQCAPAGGTGTGTGSGGSTASGAGAGGGAGGGGGDGAGGGSGGAAGAATGGTGSGTGGSSASPVMASACRDPVACSATQTTSYKTCSFGCDPRGDGTKGCPPGLLCFLYKDPAGGPDTADCGCREPTRNGGDGVACASSADCAPGFVCNQMNGTLACRRLCGLSSATDCPAPQSCRTLTNNTFGVCL